MNTTLMRLNHVIIILGVIVLGGGCSRNFSDKEIVEEVVDAALCAAEGAGNVDINEKSPLITNVGALIAGDAAWEAAINNFLAKGGSIVLLTEVLQNRLDTILKTLTV